MCVVRFELRNNTHAHVNHVQYKHENQPRSDCITLTTLHAVSLHKKKLKVILKMDNTNGVSHKVTGRIKRPVTGTFIKNK